MPNYSFPITRCHTDDLRRLWTKPAREGFPQGWLPRQFLLSRAPCPFATTWREHASTSLHACSRWSALAKIPLLIEPLLYWDFKMASLPPTPPVGSVRYLTCSATDQKNAVAISGLRVLAGGAL